MEDEARVAIAALSDAYGGVVVEDDVHDLSGGHLRFNSIEEADELGPAQTALVRCAVAPGFGRTLLAPNPTLKVGLTSNVDLELNWATWVWACAPYSIKAFVLSGVRL